MKICNIFENIYQVKNVMVVDWFWFFVVCMCEMAMMKVYMCRNGKSIYIYIFIYSSISVRTLCPMVKNNLVNPSVLLFTLEYLYDYTLLELEKAIYKLFLNMIVVIICVYCTTSFWFMVAYPVSVPEWLHVVCFVFRNKLCYCAVGSLKHIVFPWTFQRTKIQFRILLFKIHPQRVFGLVLIRPILSWKHLHRHQLSHPFRLVPIHSNH